MARKCDRGLIKAALVQIAPTLERAAECEDEINLKIATLEVAGVIATRMQTPGRERAWLTKVERALHAVLIAANRPPHPYGFDPKFLGRVKGELDGIKNLLSAIKVQRGAPQVDYAKYHAVKFGRELLLMFDQKAPLTRGGRWPELATILYEAAFGGCPVDLFEDCRRYRNPVRRPRR